MHASRVNSFACSTSRGDPENDSGIKITFRVESGADHHFLESALIPGVEGILQDVKVLQPRMVIDTFGPKPVHGPFARQGWNWMLLAMTLILAPNTRTRSFSTTREAEKGAITIGRRKLVNHKRTKVTVEKEFRTVPSSCQRHHRAEAYKLPNLISAKLRHRHGSECTTTTAST